MSSSITLLVADDHPTTRVGTINMLEHIFGVQVIGEAEDGLQTLELCRNLRPHVVLLDVRLPKMEGLIVANLLSHSTHAPRILMFSAFDNSRLVRAALAAGASGYLLKNASSVELADAIQRVLRGQQVFVGVEKPTEERIPPLSGQELTVLNYVARGMSTKEIAQEMNSSTRTIETYLNRAFYKLGANNRIQAVTIAYQEQLLLVDPV